MSTDTHEARVAASVAADEAHGHAPLVYLIPRRCRGCRQLWRDYCALCRLCPDCTKGRTCQGLQP